MSFGQINKIKGLRLKNEHSNLLTCYFTFTHWCQLDKTEVSVRDFASGLKLQDTDYASRGIRLLLISVWEGDIRRRSKYMRWCIIR